MSNPTVSYVRRAIEEARNKGGMLAGMPKVTINMADAEGLCIIADQVERLQARVDGMQEEIGNLEDRVISQGQMLRDIVNITKGPPVEKMHSTHDAVESVERLKAISDNAIRAMENL